MSIEYCHECDRNWDADLHEQCPLCGEEEMKESDREPRYDVTVQVTGADGTAFNIMAIAIRGVIFYMREQGYSAKDREEVRLKMIDECTACSSYTELLSAVARWVYIQ